MCKEFPHFTFMFILVPLHVNTMCKQWKVISEKATNIHFNDEHSHKKNIIRENKVILRVKNNNVCLNY